MDMRQEHNIDYRISVAAGDLLTCNFNIKLFKQNFPNPDLHTPF
jgi:hypothetical protein